MEAGAVESGVPGVHNVGMTRQGSDPTGFHEAGPSLDDALRFFRAERAGELRFDEHVRPLKFVTDNETGRIVAPVMVAMLETPDCALLIPEEDPDALQLLLSPEEIDGETHPTADRWRIYHGEPEDVRWAEFFIDSARLGPMVFDGDALMIANPLASAEPAACKRMNADKDALRRICKERAHVDVAAPVCVGVDPDGLHVRARFGVVRVDFDERVEAAGELEAALDRLLGGSGGA